MPWLERLDARARRWPPWLRWPYAAVKWLLVALGVYLVLGLAWHRSGLGLGIAVACVLAVIKGVLIAWSRATDSPASSPRH